MRRGQSDAASVYRYPREALHRLAANELIHRKQIRPVLDDGATAVNRIFQRP